MFHERAWKIDYNFVRYLFKASPAHYVHHPSLVSMFKHQQQRFFFLIDYIIAPFVSRKRSHLLLPLNCLLSAHDFHLFSHHQTVLFLALRCLFENTRKILGLKQFSSFLLSTFYPVHRVLWHENINPFEIIWLVAVLFLASFRRKHKQHGIYVVIDLEIRRFSQSKQIT